jgi:thiol-disulfide isomerase/thioredoxin
MHRYHLVSIFLVSIILLIPGAKAAANLPSQLKDYNFNLYSVPCPANNMVLRDLKGREVTLTAQQGKVVILNFWKIDCPPCSMEKPILERIYRKYRDRGLEIIAVNLVDGQDRIAPYVQQGGYSYTFAFDPSNRFSIRQQALRSGTPATFVVNSSSEAIYEIPGVPTSYVINRQGQVVGNAVGLVNWEQRPVTELLESLLGPAPTVVARNPTAYSEAARQGSAQPPSPRGSNATKGQTQHVLHLAQAGVDSSSTRQDAPVLPFHGTVRSKQPVTSNPPVPRTPPSPSYVQTPTMPKAYEPPAPVRRQKKNEPSRTSKPVARTPKPYNPAASRVSGSTTAHSAAAGSVRSRKRPTAATRATPPAAQPFASASPSAAPPAAQMPYLPPAMPYNPSGSRVSRPNVVPDENGTVTARIPSNAPVPGFDRFGTRGRPSAPNLPPAQPLNTRNPIDGFVLDSFGRPGMQTREVRPSGGPATPASSLFGQIGQDVQNLGAGIKDTFSRIVPGR